MFTKKEMLAMSLFGTAVSAIVIHVFEEHKHRADMRESLRLNLDWANGMIARRYQKEEKSSN